MGEMIWVEILTGHRDVIARHRCEGPEVLIGRGYDNDVVLDDPYVASRHLRIRRDETGALVAEDLGSANGTFAERGKTRLDRIVLDGDRPIRIGQTYLRIRAADHAVHPERHHAPPRRSWPVPAALAIAILGIAVLSRWLHETTEAQFHLYLQAVLVAAGMAIGWTAVWAVLSRVFSGYARFERHLVIALAALLTFSLYSDLLEAGAYAFAARSLQTYQYVVGWSLLALVCFLHLRVIGPSRTILKGGVMAALLCIVLATTALSQSETRKGNDQQDYIRRMMPPTLRVAPLRSEDVFFADTARLKPSLDRDRSKDLSPIGGGLPFVGD